MNLELRDVVKSFGPKRAVDGVSLEIPRGELLVLIGPSGCGKTTTLRMINRLIEPDAGRILIDGEDAAARSPVALRRRMGYVIQHVGLFPHMTVAKNVAAVPRLLGWDAKRTARRTAELLEMVGLDPAVYAAAWPSTLSGGEAQRVGVARALAADPPVLLMDEPFGAVDPLARASLQDEFLRIQKTLGKTVVFVTHDLDEAIRLGDRIAVMNEGRLVRVAAPERLLMDDDPFVRDFTGEDRALRRLARITAADAAGAARRPAPGRAAGGIRASCSLKDALSLMLETGADALDLLGADGRPADRLTLEDVLRAASDGEGDAR